MQARFALPARVCAILSDLRAAGYEAYAVGGAVRDLCLGKAPSDFDITTSATPQEVTAVFAADKTVPTGIKHGTVTLVRDGVGYEITTYRLDGDYNDKRHPNGVTFTRSLSEDLRRRDFTVNAMALSDQEGPIDLFGGTSDLAAGIIRAVGEPKRRFTEDALRILRALRFASALDFTIEDETSEALLALAPSLTDISGERIYAELKKFFAGAGCDRLIRAYFPVLTAIFPEWAGVNPNVLPSFRGLDFVCAFAALFFLAGVPTEAAVASFEKLHPDRAGKLSFETVLNYLYKKDYPTQDADFALLRIRYADADIARILSLLPALGLAEAGTLAAYGAFAEKGMPRKIKDLAVTAADLLALGLRGEKIGKTLDSLLLLAATGKAENEKSALLSQVTDR